MSTNDIARILGLSAGLGLLLGCETGAGSLDGRIVGLDVVRSCASPDSVPAGHPCACNTDCAGDAVDCQPELALGIPRGMCADECGSDAECGPGTFCNVLATEVMGFRGFCMPSCVTNADCPAGRSCGQFASGLYCYPICQADADCGSGFCDEHTGRCTEDSPPTTGLPLLGECTRGDECRSGRCIDGACEALCSLEHDGCPDGSFCSVYDEGDLGLCGPPCATNVDCRAFPAAVCDQSYNPAGVGYCRHTDDDVNDPCVSGSFTGALIASAGCNGPPLGPNVPDNQFGGHCTLAPDTCAAPNFCHNGICLQHCVRGGITNTSTCPSGSRCWFLDGGTCYPDCDGGDDCVSGSCDALHSCE